MLSIYINSVGISYLQKRSSALL